MQRELYLSLQPPLLYGAKVNVEGWRVWTDKALARLEDPKWGCCHICGRERDWLFNFARLVTVWDGEKVVKECRWHGPKVLWDCQTGEEVVIPEPPRWPQGRRAFEALVLKAAMAVRFCYFLGEGLFWRMVARSDLTFETAAQGFRGILLLPRPLRIIAASLLVLWCIVIWPVGLVIDFFKGGVK